MHSTGQRYSSALISPMLASRLKRETRWKICQSCEHLTESGTCGTPFIGNTLPDGTRLCGCFMKVKSTLAYAACTQGKWSEDTHKTSITQAQIDQIPFSRASEMKLLIDTTKGSLNHNQAEQMRKFIHEYLYPMPKLCGSCSFHDHYKRVELTLSAYDFGKPH